MVYSKYCNKDTTMKAIKNYRLDHLKKLAEENDRTANIHVTDLSRCLTGVYYEKIGQGISDMNESKLRRFDAGNIIEGRVVEACKQEGVLVSAQGQLEWPEYNMVGSYDLIIQEDGQYWLIEVKSIHPYGITRLYKTNKPHEHYVEQVNLYLNKLREIYPTIKARLYYEALDGRTAEFEIEYDPEIVRQALQKAQGLFDAITNKIPPEPGEPIIQEDGKWCLDWRIKYCIQSGLHYKCAGDPLDPDPEKWVRKLEYKAKKMNK